MRLRETLLGLAVLGLVLGGVFWARGRGAPLSGPHDPDAGPVVDAEAALADVTRLDGAAAADGVLIRLAVEPRPVVAFAAHRYRVRAERDGEAVPIAAGRLSFEMTMPMGEHRYDLLPGADGWQEAEVVLPLCPSGKRRWFATFEGTVAGEGRRARFRFDLASPPPKPAP